MKRSSLAIAFVFFVAGLFLFLYDIGGLYYGIQSRGWPSVQGEITVARITTEMIPWRNRTRGVSRLEIEYRYSVNDVTFTGERVSAGRRSVNYPEQMISEFPVGKTVMVHFQPDDHSVSFLKTGIDKATYLYAGAGALILGIAIAFLIVGLRTKKFLYPRTTR